MTAETVLLRVKRRGEQWLEKPVLRCAAYFGGGLLLSSLQLWGRMQPVAVGFAAAAAGWRCCAAALGSGVGYMLLFGQEGLQGGVWALGAMLLGLLLPLLDGGGRARFRLAAGCMCLVSGTGLAFGLAGAPGPELLFLRIALAGGSALVAEPAISGRDRLSRWLGCGVGVMALAGLWPALGWLAAGAAAAGAPLPAALAAALGAELAGGTEISLTAAVGLAFFLARLLPQGEWRSAAAPPLACGALMVLGRVWEPWVLVFVGLGAAVGALLPWKLTAAPRRSILGRAQVRLEQTARVLGRFQRQLLEYASPPPDIPGLYQQLKQDTCGTCPARKDCVEKARLTESLLTGEEEFQCRKALQAGAALHRSREQLRRIRSARARQEEYRMALVQQYGFLSDTLQALSDQLTERTGGGKPRYRVQVSARSRGKLLADGDRVSAFPGVGCKYYVLLCDGMGTGLGAAEESRQASELMKEMLTAGMAPGAVLGCLNSQLTLMDRGGAVTADLAELRLDTGRVWLYKWGAGPSWLLRRKHLIRIGSSGPPPGLGITAGRESVSRASLGLGDSLVMLSDGVDTGNAKSWPAMARNADPGTLAAQILSCAGNQGDDATAVVIRLQPHAPPEG